MKYIQENDCRSDFGMNVKRICDINNVSVFNNVKFSSVKYHPVPEHEQWRIPILSEINDILHKNLYLDFSDTDLCKYSFYSLLAIISTVVHNKKFNNMSLYIINGTGSEKSLARSENMHFKRNFFFTL